MKLRIFSLLSLFFCSALYGQSLHDNTIRKMAYDKRGIFLENGIFYSPVKNTPSQLKQIRNSFSASSGQERMVFDFTTAAAPKIYGYIDEKNNRLMFDLFKTEIVDGIESLGDSAYVERIKFFPIDDDLLSVEIVFKDNVSLDVFYLALPGRFVVDIKR